MLEENYNAEALVTMRKALQVSQTEFSQWMGVPMRTLQELENGRSPIRAIHIRAAEMAALLIAQANHDADRLPKNLRDLANDIAFFSA